MTDRIRAKWNARTLAKGALAVIVGLILAVFIAAWISPIVASADASDVPHAGIFWNVKLDASEAVQRERIARVVTDRVWVVWSEAEFFSCPRLAEFSRDANPACAVVLSINGWGCFPDQDVPVTYWPTHRTLTAIADEYGAWLTDVTGSEVHTPWNIKLFDVRNPAMQAALIATTAGMIDAYHVDALFIDECHGEPYLASRLGRPPPDVAGWELANRRIMRALGPRVPGGIIINGTCPLTTSLYLVGWYEQNAWTKSPAVILDKLKAVEMWDADRRRVCIQTDGSAFWQGIAARFPGVSVQEGATFSDLAPQLLLRDVSIAVDVGTRAVRIAGAP